MKRSIWDAIAENLVGSEDVPLLRDVAAPGPDFALERLSAELDEALMTLEPVERCVLRLRHGLDDPDGRQEHLLAISDRMGVSVRTVTRVLSSGRRKLYAELRRRGFEVSNSAHALDMGRKLA